MLVYTKTFPAPLTLVLRWYGAATGRAAPYALVCAAATLALHVAVPARVRDRYEEGWLHPYPFQTFAYVAGFAIVFRNNYAYQRYLQAREGLQQMGSKFADLTSQAMAFDLVQDVPDTGEAPPARAARRERELEAFRDAFVHLVSLLHALALQHFREDWNLDNLIPFASASPHPALNLRAQHAQAGTRPATAWDLPVFKLGALPAGERAQGRMNVQMPLGVVGGLSDEEKALLSYGADGGSLNRGPFAPGAERAALCMHWLQTLIVAQRAAGGLQVPGPVLSRLQQVLSDGMAAYNQCRRFTDSPFPMPYANAVMLVLLMYTVSLPMLMWCWVTVPWLSATFAFIASMTYWLLHEVARDLEDPFLYEPNELPLPRKQHLFNERILQFRRVAASPSALPAPVRRLAARPGLVFDNGGASLTRRVSSGALESGELGAAAPPELNLKL